MRARRPSVALTVRHPGPVPAAPPAASPDTASPLPRWSALAVPAAAVGPHTVTSGRALGTAAVLVAVGGVVVGRRAWVRSTGGHGGDRRDAVGALAAGLVAVAVGGYVLAVAQGGPGTGYGVVGGYGALVIGLVATGLGGLALARSRRTRTGTGGRSDSRTR